MPKHKRKRKPRRTGRALLRASLLFLLAAAALLAWELLGRVGGNEEVFVDIPAHTGTMGMAERLHHAGVIRSAWAFDLLREAEGGTLKAGEYRFAHPASLLEVYSRLRRGDVFTVQVTIPEGSNLFDIAQIVQGTGLVSGDAFLAAARTDLSLVHGWAPGAVSLEGYLFPDTYRFSRHTTPELMLQTMTRRFGQVALHMGLAGPALPRVVTLASLVEREVHADGERPVVAGVFENRLKRGMPLQTDPSVVYGSLLQGTWTGVIHQSELHSASPYNTYAHAGLPPGPICNPGVAALQAALHPAQTDYLYFVANADGSTQFARTLAEHAANVAAYRRSQQ